MKQLFTILLLAIFVHQLTIAQSFPMTIIGENKIHDVFFQENSIVYATDNRIVEVNENNEKIVVDDHSWSINFSGTFTPQENGWVYIGWPIYSDEVTYPGFGIRKSNEDNIIEHFAISPTLPEAITYQSDDRIYVLYFVENNGIPQYKINILDIEGNIIQTLDIDVDVSLRNMILLEDNLNLLTSLTNLYTFSDKIEHEIAFDAQIFDVKLTENGTIKVMTEEGIHLLDKELTLLSTIPVVNEGQFPTNFAFNSFGDKNYLLERNLDNDFITILDSDGETISEFQEMENIFYRDLKAAEDKVAIWGRTSCPQSSYLLKLDNGNANSQLQTNDIELSEFNLVLTDVQFDTIFNGDNYVVFITKEIEWEIEVTNLSNSAIPYYQVRSNDFFAIDQININIEEFEPLNSGETRTYTGEFTISNSTDDIKVWVSSNAVDVNCDNNIQTAEIPTSSKEINIEYPISISPNPATTNLYLKGASDVPYTIFNKIGKTINHGVYNQNKGINIQGLSHDVYFIKAGDRNKQQVLKFIKI